jgi:hypothetical protein
MRIPLTILFTLLMVSRAFAWGEQGHRGIAEAVHTQLDPATVKAISKITGTGDTLPLATDANHAHVR